MPAVKNKKLDKKSAAANSFNFIDVFENVDTKIAALIRKSVSIN